jgi:hypothetical protein
MEPPYEDDREKDEHPPVNVEAILGVASRSVIHKYSARRNEQITHNDAHTSEASDDDTNPAQLKVYRPKYHTARRLNDDPSQTDFLRKSHPAFSHTSSLRSRRNRGRKHVDGDGRGPTRSVNRSRRLTFVPLKDHKLTYDQMRSSLDA